MGGDTICDDANANNNNKAIATAKINSYVVNYKIFTDGSTDGKQTNGGAGTYIEDADGREVATYEEPAGALCSSYGGECVAMLRACKWIREREQRGRRTCCVDCH